MKIRVKLDENIYDVEVGDLRERPITAKIDGITFEVWPESKVAYTSDSKSRLQGSSSRQEKVNRTPAQNINQPERKISIKSNQVIAPIPGIITGIFVQAGASVTLGQELCKLEAMKMNNIVRASRGGMIGSIAVSIGQHVKHGDVLMEFAEE